MISKCEVCRINRIFVKDYRRVDDIYDNYLVCSNCCILNDNWFFKLKYSKEGIGKKRILSKIVEGTWKAYIIP